MVKNFLSEVTILNPKTNLPHLTVLFAGNASLRWLNNVGSAYLVQVSLILIGQQGWGHFSGIGLAFDWLEDFANCRPTPEKYNKYSANHS
jgi:hypothetical protein